ncbi:MAG: hypothetical protein L3J52_03585 [Proteobacteria bacterium]|nr:hypothetical protein [Pseudomonadota bacterium]
MKAFFNLKTLFGLLQKTKNNTVYFAHIPKTAGTSFIVLLDRYFCHESIFPNQLWRKIESIDKLKYNQYALFRGHFGGGGIKALTDSPLDTLTILRHPQALSYSSYRFVLREKDTVVHQLVSKQSFSFSQFLQHPKTRQLVKNRLVRNLSFDFEHDSAAQEVFLSPQTIKDLKPLINSKQPDLTDKERYQRAKEFIKKCRWFGVQERFDESMQLFCFKFLLPPIGNSQKLNPKKSQMALTDKEKSCLDDLNPWDLRLYEYAGILFDQAYLQMCNELEDLRSSKAQNVDELIDIHYQNKQKQPLQDQVNYRFNQKLLGSNWHRRELMKPDNEFFRWTGPKTVSYIDFWVKKQTYELQIRIINAIDEDVLNNLQININDHRINWQTDQQSQMRVLTGIIPKEYISKNGLLRLFIDTINVDSHAQAFNSNDERQVAVAIHWIKLMPCKKNPK